tara:strand:+ start:903 stop:1085 length:183 start_codon:yes stop_codon:yes gene_type:complete
MFMFLFLTVAWSALGFTPDKSMALEQELNYFPAPTAQEIQAVLKHVHRKRLAMSQSERSF